MDELVFGWRTALLLLVFGQLVLAAILLMLRKFDRLANWILAALLLVIGFALIPQIIGFAGFYDSFPWLSFAPFQVELLAGPLIWLYATALTRGRLPHWVWLVLVPGAVDFLYQSYWFLQPFETRWERIGAFHSGFYWPARTWLAIGLTYAGLFAAWRAYQSHRQFINDYSSAAAEFDPRWLPVFLGICGVVLAAWSATEFTNSFITRLNYFDSYPLHVLVALSFWGMGQAALILQREAFPKITDVVDKNNPREPGRDWGREADILRQRIRDENWHLEPRLSAPDLARRIGTNESYLSRTVNQGAGVNFNRFVNEIRVEAVKSSLQEGTNDVLAAALDSGFNSKATFNRVFKEIAGQTPAAFRAENAV
ncbi:helix-turn-helix domain-containing protein [Hyphobacterium sp.]|uniref:helix-turn-helix domain-containing protein n=1 Tax=Hyphobacterium sp. TaxID=2004662 RepID=UPI003BA8AD0D